MTATFMSRTQTLGETKIKDLKEQDLQAFLNKLAEGYSESVVKNARLYLRAILEEALQARIIDVNPAARIVKPHHRGIGNGVGSRF